MLDEATANEIKEAYYNLHKEDFGSNTADIIKIVYYGEYNGSYVMFVHSVYGYLQVVSPEIIDGVLFNYSCSHTLDVYNDGKFYTVQGAFDNGLLTHDDLLEITSYWEEYIYCI